MLTWGTTQRKEQLGCGSRDACEARAASDGVGFFPHKRWTHAPLTSPYPAALMWATTILHPITLCIFAKCKHFFASNRLHLLCIFGGIDYRWMSPWTRDSFIKCALALMSFACDRRWLRECSCQPSALSHTKSMCSLSAPFYANRLLSCCAAVHNSIELACLWHAYLKVHPLHSISYLFSSERLKVHTTQHLIL
jgi:hypothetical protein